MEPPKRNIKSFTLLPDLDNLTTNRERGIMTSAPLWTGPKTKY